VSRRSFLLLAVFTTGVALAEISPHDPTMPFGYWGRERNSKITAVMITKNQKNVIINGETLTVGDEVNDKKIIAITIHGITLENQNGTTEIIPVISEVKDQTSQNTDFKKKVGSYEAN
jgi:hypothetical protein